MITPSDFIADEMDRLTPTVTVFILDAAFSYDDDPTNIASDLSAFNNKLLSANQCVTACEQIFRVDNLELMVVTHTLPGTAEYHWHIDDGPRHDY